MKLRIITAVIAIVLFFPIVFYGGWVFKALVYLIATIGLLELLKMRMTINYFIPFAITILLLWGLLIPVTEQELMEVLSITKAEITLIGVLLLLSYTVLVKNKFTFEDAGFLVLSAIYIGTGFYYFMNAGDAGVVFIFYGIIVVLATDTGAYFFGRAFGRKKLWPQISPNKTVEGAIGGVLLACVIAVLFHWLFPLPHSLPIIIVVTIIASAAGQIGDLVESAFKRHYDVKDSGKILPGHGGILDRFDSWLFIFPLLHFIHFIS
ncbi:phosphatidate cytidylyltransferase [Sediminibacillus halophilus]|uniref:Phosphatidate cytidylyltransferase n=1 Tax=Sediminibacillus halophilus TaxID=482461 RepID=A0A1G9MHP7_9BACI|nr:phosphatidate cytidylyltransferase [Sediminibacillus halophilus]SDL73185.1 phosphatidate cytidylyltransferase [Sediminibacillus halophilus]